MINLRDYQQRAVDNVQKAEREGVRRPLIVHPTGTGKGHPLHVEVPTPGGWRLWGDLVPGDLVFGSDGTPTEVTAVHDRGVLPTYRVGFSDGSEVEVDGDHLWRVRDYRYRRTSGEIRTLSTSEIRDKGLAFGSSRRWAVPMVGPVEYGNWEAPPIEAYTLGSLIANGSLMGSGTTLTTPDLEVVSRIRGAGHTVNTGSLSAEGQCPRYSLPGLSGYIRDLGLNVHSRVKFIPARYLQATAYQRIALLQGLMDGDGSSREGRRTVNYHTTSPRLAADVRNLVASLGGTARINAPTRLRNDVPYQDIAVKILLPSGIEPFSSSRKKGRSRPRRIFEPRRTIVAVERVQDQEIRCITVAAPDHLYVVGRDYIVTHNTVTFSHLIQQRADRGRSIVLVHREELARQTREKIHLVAPELSVGIVKAAENEIHADVVIASVPTIQGAARMGQLLEAAKDRPFATIIADEGHHSPSPSWTRVLTALGAFHPYGPLAVGLTATPERDKKTLGVWERVVDFMSIREAIFSGYLVPILPAVVVETDLDMKKVRKTGGDFSERDLGQQIEDSGAIRQMADAVLEHAADRKGVAFLPTIRTSEMLADALRARGIRAEHLDGTTEKDERRAILKRLKTGETQWVTNCAVLTEGFDEPSISCVLVGRPTTFHGLYVQMVGRGTRLSPGKKDLLLIDMVAASRRHEFIGYVDLGLELDEARGKKGPGEGAKCPQCDEACEDEDHRCELCRRYLPASARSRRHDNCRAGKAGKIDVFGESRLAWLPLPSGAYCLTAGKEVVVMVPNDADTWTLAAYESGRIEKLHDQLPADWAMGIGEDRAKAFQRLAERKASWRRSPASSAQKNRLILQGFPENKIHLIKTMGEASDLSTRITGRMALKKLGVRL